MSNAFDQIFSSTNAKNTPKLEAIKAEAVKQPTPKVVAKQPVREVIKPKIVDNSNTQVLPKSPTKKYKFEELEASEDNVEYIKVIKKVKKVPVTLGKGKTFFFEPDMMEFFKYVKFRKKIDESLYARQVFEKAFCEEFGEDWRKMVG